MSTITQVGSYAKYLGLVRNLTAGQQKVDDLSQQLTTGKKSVDLNAYGAETQKLLELRAELVKRDNYVQQIDTALPRVKASSVVLDQLEKMASDWQSNNLMPFQPGPPSITSPFNAKPDAMSVTVDPDKSKFTQNARYTVTAVPSQNGENGTFDITVSDGLGGTSTRSLNLKTVPPNDGGGYNFAITGGPGEGAVLNLNFDKLQAASSSSFTVTWPQADQTRERVEGALRDIQQMLNERFGDRYLFAGSRYSTEPVGDLLAQKQTSKVTFNGPMTEKDDYYELKVGGHIISCTNNGNSLDVFIDGQIPQSPTPPSYTIPSGVANTVNVASAIAQTMASAIQLGSLNLPMIVSQANGIITMVGNEPGKPFDVTARVQNRTTIENSLDTPQTTQNATLPDPLLPPPLDVGLPQIDSFSLHGVDVDIGDTFEFTVAVGDPDDPYNQKHYNENPHEPRDLPPYQEYTVRYTVSEQDYNGGVTDVTQVAAKLREQFGKLDPAPPIAIGGVGPAIELTSNTPLDPNHPTRQQLFSTSAKAINGSIDNTVSVATLPSEAFPITDVPYVNPPDLPFYDTEYLTKRQNAKAFDKAAVTADDGLSLTYGVTSDDRAFQKLITAFRMAHVAASNPGKYEEYISKSRELMAQAKDEVRSVHAKVASDLSTLEQKSSAHKDAMATVTERVAKIEGIDETEVAARLRASMNALEAAYTVAGQTQKLSLLNYIA